MGIEKGRHKYLAGTYLAIDGVVLDNLLARQCIVPLHFDLTHLMVEMWRKLL